MVLFSGVRGRGILRSSRWHRPTLFLPIITEALGLFNTKAQGKV
jgi:hypothetical protein